MTHHSLVTLQSSDGALNAVCMEMYFYEKHSSGQLLNRNKNACETYNTNWMNKAQKLKHINFDAQQIMMALNNVVVGFYTSSCQIEIYTAVIRCVANEIRRFLMLCVSNGEIIVWEHHLNWLLSTTPQIDHIYQLVNLSNRNDKAREREKLRFSLDCYR